MSRTCPICRGPLQLTKLLPDADSEIIRAYHCKWCHITEGQA